MIVVLQVHRDGTNYLVIKMTGNELKEVFEGLIERHNLRKEICEDLLNELENLGEQSIGLAHIEKVNVRINVLYKLNSFSSDSWSEFNDKDFADWKRVSTAIEKENTLINQRLTWLLSSQTVLFTAFTLVLIQANKSENNSSATSVYPLLLLTIAVFGILISIYIWRIIESAINQLNNLDRWWCGERDWKRLSKRKKLPATEPYKSEIQLIRNHPPLKGRPWNFFDREIVNAERIPFLFVFIWSFIISFTGVLKLDDINNFFFKNWKELLIAIMFSIIILLLIYIFAKRRRP